MSEETTNQTPNFQQWLDSESDEIVKQNIEKLVQLDEYEIAGKVYKRKMLKPRDVMILAKLDKEQNEFKDDPEKQYDILKQQSKVCLDGMTDMDFENTDGVMLQNVIAACRIIAKGFRKL